MSVDEDPFTDLPWTPEDPPPADDWDTDLRTLNDEGPQAWPKVVEPGTAADDWTDDDRDDDGQPPLYADVAAYLAGELPDPPAPVTLTRKDGHALFYAGQVNLIFGDPESGKTWVALAAVAESLRSGGRGLVIDLDHNGMEATIGRLLMLGAPPKALSDLTRFRYTEPDDVPSLSVVVVDAHAWRPDVVVVDSMGELIPLYGVSSNSPDDFTMVHKNALKPFAKIGATVLVVDHLAKNPDSRAHGATGTAAKRRAVGGVSLRVKVVEAFTPGKGGAAHLTIHKDRHGGLRANCPTGDGEPHAGTFRLSTDPDGSVAWAVHAPAGVTPVAIDADLDALRQHGVALGATVEEVRKVMGWRKSRAATAMRHYRAAGIEPGSPVPTPVSEPGTAGNRRELSAGGTGFPNLTHQWEPGTAAPEEPLRYRAREPKGTAKDPSRTRCTICGQLLAFALTAVGQTTHPTCTDPQEDAW